MNIYIFNIEQLLLNHEQKININTFINRRIQFSSLIVLSNGNSFKKRIVTTL